MMAPDDALAAAGRLGDDWYDRREWACGLEATAGAVYDA